MLKRDTCIYKLKNIITDQNIIYDCEVLMKNVVESRHKRVLARQKAKCEALHQQKIGGCSNKGHCTDQYSIHTQHSTSDEIQKWVVNLSNKPLTEDQEKLLARGPKFSIKPRWPPVDEYITAIEKVCQKLEQGTAQELRVEVKKILKKAQDAPRSPSNITREEIKALHELKKDKERIILTRDKGVALVVMDKADYISKSEELLNTSTYKEIPEDPTNRQKSRLINLLKNIKSEGGLNEEIYKKMYPTGAVSPKYYGLPQNSQSWNTIEAHNIQYWDSHIKYSKGLGQNFEALSGIIQPSCTKHQGLHRTD